MIPQAQRATAFHFLISNRLAFLVEDDVETVEEEGPAPPDPSPAGTIVTSVSREAIVVNLKQTGKARARIWDTVWVSVYPRSVVRLI